MSGTTKLAERIEAYENRIRELEANFDNERAKEAALVKNLIETVCKQEAEIRELRATISSLDYFADFLIETHESKTAKREGE